MEKILTKKESAGFAYSERTLVIKIKAREVGKLFAVELSEGTKGGTLDESSAKFPTKADADKYIETVAAKALANGYQEV